MSKPSLAVDLFSAVTWCSWLQYTRWHDRTAWGYSAATPVLWTHLKTAPPPGTTKYDTTGKINHLAPAQDKRLKSFLYLISTKHARMRRVVSFVRKMTCFFQSQLIRNVISWTDISDVSKRRADIEFIGGIYENSQEEDRRGGQEWRKVNFIQIYVQQCVVHLKCVWYFS